MEYKILTLMQIQDVINALSNILAALHDIKMQKVRAEITEVQAKKKAREILERSLNDSSISKAIEEWK